MEWRHLGGWDDAPSTNDRFGVAAPQQSWACSRAAMGRKQPPRFTSSRPLERPPRAGSGLSLRMRTGFSIACSNKMQVVV